MPQTRAERLQIIAHKLGYSQKDLAERLGLTQQAVSFYMNGKRQITRVLALALAYTDNVNPDWLMEGRGSVFVEPGAGRGK